jgi:adenosine deaminase
VTAAGDPELTKRLAASKITLEVCPASNVALGVAAAAADVPVPELLGDGIPIALGADDPLLFGSRLTAQYEIARRVHGLADEQLAELARMSVRGSTAAPSVARRLLRGIDAWLARPPGNSPEFSSPG